MRNLLRWLKDPRNLACFLLLLLAMALLAWSMQGFFGMRRLADILPEPPAEKQTAQNKGGKDDN